MTKHRSNSEISNNFEYPNSTSSRKSTSLNPLSETKLRSEQAALLAEQAKQNYLYKLRKLEIKREIELEKEKALKEVIDATNLAEITALELKYEKSRLNSVSSINSEKPSSRNSTYSIPSKHHEIHKKHSIEHETKQNSHQNSLYLFENQNQQAFRPSSFYLSQPENQIPPSNENRTPKSVENNTLLTNLKPIPTEPVDTNIEKPVSNSIQNEHINNTTLTSNTQHIYSQPIDQFIDDLIEGQETELLQPFQNEKFSLQLAYKLYIETKKFTTCRIKKIQWQLRTVARVYREL